MRKGIGLCALALALALGPVPAFASEEAPPALGPINADAYIVMDASSGQVLLEKNADEIYYPASITKILTLGLALEAKADPWAAMDEEIEMTYEAAHSLISGAAHVALTENELLKFKDLLYATQIRSANEAAYMLAQHTAGTKDGFTGMMNAKAEALGLVNSHFTNPSGLPDNEHYTTAYDMAEITRWALSVPAFRQIFSTTHYVMEPTNKQPQERVFSTSNYLLVPQSSYYYEGVVGSKTGHTTAAGYTLVTVAQRGDVELICVLLKCSTANARMEDTHTLLDYCFANYTYASFPAARVEGSTVPVYGDEAEPIGQVTVCLEEENAPRFLLHNSLTASDVEYTVHVPEQYNLNREFAPAISLRLSAASPYQRQELGEFALQCLGLDAVLGTYAGQAEQYVELPKRADGGIWMVGGAALLLVAFGGRILYVRYRRAKRRKARRAAARAYLPVSMGPRPRPQGPARQSGQAAGAQSAFRQVYVRISARQAGKNNRRRLG